MSDISKHISLYIKQANEAIQKGRKKDAENILLSAAELALNASKMSHGEEKKKYINLFNQLKEIILKLHAETANKYGNSPDNGGAHGNNFNGNLGSNNAPGGFGGENQNRSPSIVREPTNLQPKSSSDRSNQAAPGGPIVRQPSGIAPGNAGNAPRQNAPYNNAPQGNAPQGNAPRQNAPQGADVKPKKQHDPNDLSPHRLEDYIGQPQAIKAIRDLIIAAKIKRTAMPHIILYGSHGLGKTTFSKIIAEELGANFIEINAMKMTPIELISILQGIKPRDVVFIDEIHTVPLNVAESVLYSAMQDRRIVYNEGKGKNVQTRTIDLPPFTLIGATTEIGKLAKPFSQRAILVHLYEYSAEIIGSIIQRSFSRLGMSISSENAYYIALRCRNNPRIANNTVKRLSDKALVDFFTKHGNINGDFSTTEAIRRLGIVVELPVIDKFFEENGIDKYGLEDGDRNLLRIIIERFKGGPVGAENLAKIMNESNNVIAQKYEPYLIKNGFMRVEKDGRYAMRKAYEALGFPVPKGLIEAPSEENADKSPSDAPFDADENNGGDFTDDNTSDTASFGNGNINGGADNVNPDASSFGNGTFNGSTDNVDPNQTSFGSNNTDVGADNGQPYASSSGGDNFNENADNGESGTNSFGNDNPDGNADNGFGDAPSFGNDNPDSGADNGQPDAPFDNGDRFDDNNGLSDNNSENRQGKGDRQRNKSYTGYFNGTIEENIKVLKEKYKLFEATAAYAPEDVKCEKVENLIVYPPNAVAVDKSLDELFPDFPEEYDVEADHDSLLEIDFDTHKRLIVCDSALERRFASIMALIGYITDMKAQAFTLRYVTNALVSKKYLPDFIIKDYKGRIAIIEMKNYEAMSYHLNIDKYEKLKAFCEKKGYGYAEVMREYSAETYVSVEQLRQRPVNRELYDHIVKTMEENERATGKKVFTQDDFKAWASSFGEEQARLEIVTLLLNERHLKNVKNVGFNIVES